MKFTLGFMPTKLFYIHWKNTFTKSNRREINGVPFFLPCICFIRLPRSLLSAWKSPPESSSLSVREKDGHGALGVRVLIQTMFAVGLHVLPLAARLDGSKLCDWPFMCGRICQELMYIIYNARLQRPSAGSRVCCARGLPVPSLATGLIIIIRTSRSDSYYILPQEGSGDTCLYQRPGTWPVLRSSAPRLKPLKHESVLKLNSLSNAYK